MCFYFPKHNLPAGVEWNLPFAHFLRRPSVGWLESEINQWLTNLVDKSRSRVDG
jgi:hypothetical protein